MEKLQYVLRRSIQLVLTIWAVSTALFVLFRLMPGNPTSYVVSPDMSPEVRQRIIESYGLNEPIWVQYTKYLTNLVQLDLGRSFHSNEPVTAVIATYLPNTLVLMLSSLLIAYAIGITLGVLTAWYRGSRFEKTTVVAALLARSVPSFWIGIIVLWIAGARLDLIPMSGMRSIGTTPNGFWQMVFTADFLWHLVTPAAVLAFYYTGYPLLVMRNSMLGVLSQDFIVICRAKGLSERSIMFNHAARNAMLPVLTAAAIAVGFAIGGSVLIETVFGWPGLGREMIRAVLRRDYPVAQGTFVVLASAVIIMNFVADTLYGILDPRVTYD